MTELAVASCVGLASFIHQAEGFEQGSGGFLFVVRGEQVASVLKDLLKAAFVKRAAFSLSSLYRSG